MVHERNRAPPTFSPHCERARQLLTVGCRIFQRRNLGLLQLSRSTVDPQRFLNEIVGFKISSRSYLLKCGVPRHPDVIDR